MDIHPGLPLSTYSLGIYSALATTIIRLIYFLFLIFLLLTGQFTLPLSEKAQLIAGIITLISCPFIVVVMACLHIVTPPDRKVFSLGSLAFTVLFAMSVSINRFTQLGVVRQSLAQGTASGVDWFLPYGDHSVMFGLEMLGWGWFLGMAMLLAAPIFSGGRTQGWIRWLMISYAVLGLLSAVSYLLASPLAAVGFIAWGVILFVITYLLAVFFKSQKRQISAGI